MSGKPVSFRASQSDRERLAAFADDENISNADAARRALDHGLAAQGYGSASSGGTTTLETYAWETAKVCLWFSFAVGGAQVATPVDFSAVVMGFVAAAILFLGLQAAEPGVSEWLRSARTRGADREDGGPEVAD